MVETYLGFDVGTKRIGVAIANSLTFEASPLDFIKHHKDGSYNWEDFDRLMGQYDLTSAIVGLPKTEDNQDQEMTFIAKSFARKLNERYQIPVHLIDEHLSSIEAKKTLKYNHDHENSDRGEVDKYAAKLILQTWLNENR